MGKSIHTFIEIGEGKFIYCHAKVNIVRDYDLLNVLSEFPVRGLPDNVCGTTHSEFFLLVAEPEDERAFREGGQSGIAWMTRHEADEHVASGESFYKKSEATGKDAWVSHPAWYGTSWLTLEECEEVLRLYKEKSSRVNWGFAVVVETMRSIESYTSKGFTRLVFWFDW
jgi:hypothetical protein